LEEGEKGRDEAKVEKGGGKEREVGGDEIGKEDYLSSSSNTPTPLRRTLDGRPSCEGEGISPNKLCRKRVAEPSLRVILFCLLDTRAGGVSLLPDQRRR